MAYKRVKHDEILKRQEMVAGLRARRMTERAIMEAINEMKDPKTGLLMFLPVKHVTIHNDLCKVRENMDARSVESMESWRSQEVADIEEIEAAAWRDKRLDLVLKAKERKHKILGLDKPELVIPDEINLNVIYKNKPDKAAGDGDV